MLQALLVRLLLGASPSPAYTLADPSVDLDAKRAVLAAAEPLAPFERAELLRRVEPLTAQQVLCHENRGRVPEMTVRVEAETTYGVAVRAVVFLQGEPDSRTPITLRLPSCTGRVLVRLVETGETREVPVDGDLAVARFGDRWPTWVVGPVADLSWIAPGWGDGAQVNPSGGARLDWWGEHFHFSAALRLGTFAYRWLVRPPVLPVADLFAGVIFASGTEQLRVYYGVDLGLWSVVCATARLIGALAFGQHFITVGLDLHVYPIFLAGDHAALYARVPFENYLFWGAEAGWGMRF